MASLAPHVSRTPAACPPHGFSVYQDVNLQMGLLSATSADISLIYAEDSDYFIEKISIASGVARGLDGSNHWTMLIQNAGVSGTGTANVSMWTQNSGAGGVALDKNKFYEIPWQSESAKFLADGESLRVTFTKEGTAASGHFTLQVRYRRKA